MTPNSPSAGLIRRPAFAGLVATALAAELGYAVLNISTMPVYLRDDRHLGEGMIGLVLVAFLLTEALAKGFMGRIADQHGSRIPMIAGPLLSLTACLLTVLLPKTGGTAPELIALLLLRAVDGFAAATFWPAVFAQAGRVAESSRRQEAMSLLNICYLLGLALALPLGGAVDDLTHTHQAGLFLAAGLFAVAALLSLLLVPSQPSRSSLAPETTQKAETEKPDLKRLVAPVALTLITFVGVGFPMAILKLFAVDALRLTETQFGALIVPGALAMAGLSVPIARLGERIGSHRSVSLGLGLCTLGTLLIGLGAIFPTFRSLIILAGAAIPVGLGFTLALPAWMASVSEIDPERQGAYLGAVMAAQGFGAIVGAPLGGLLYEKLQRIGFGQSFGYYSPFLACAVCVGAGWFLSFFVGQAKPEVKQI